MGLQWRPARVPRPMPRPLLENCTTYLEEQLYVQGFGTLSSALVAGTDVAAPALVPPPQHVAFAATLAVHPAFTTRTLNDEKLQAARSAVGYLRDVVRSVRLREANLDNAFDFTGNMRGNRDRDHRAQLRRVHAASGEEDEVDEGARIHSMYANEQSLFQCTEDFWSVVGWAMNCAYHHHARWSVWQIWLEAMLDALESDLHERAAISESEADLSATLFRRYLYGANGRQVNLRRVLRAILADGSPKSTAEFPEIWRNETDPPRVKVAEPSRKRRKLDIENDEFGDYFDDDSEVESPVADPGPSSSSVPEEKRKTVSQDDVDDSDDSDNDSDDSEDTVTRPGPRRVGTDESSAFPEMGGPSCLRVRQRLLALLLDLSQKAPSVFVEFDDLLAMLTDFLRPLPNKDFAAFVLPRKAYLDGNTQMSLNEALFRPIIAARAPHNPKWEVTLAVFKRCYAPFAANTASDNDNCKASLLCESMLRVLRDDGQLAGENAGLVTAVQTGIDARREKAARGRNSCSKQQVTDWGPMVLHAASAARIRLMLRMCKTAPTK